jgi:hypothetical protein
MRIHALEDSGKDKFCVYVCVITIMIRIIAIIIIKLTFLINLIPVLTIN